MAKIILDEDERMEAEIEFMVEEEANMEDQAGDDIDASDQESGDDDDASEISVDVLANMEDHDIDLQRDEYVYFRLQILY